MAKTRFTMKPAFGADEAARIAEYGIDLLERLGIECRHQGIQEELVRKPGFSVKNHRVFFSRDLCREHILKLRELNAARERGKPRVNNAEQEPDRITLTPLGPWTSLNVLDMESGRPRPGTLANMVEATKLLNALEIKGWGSCAPVFPYDVPTRMACLAMCKESWLYTPHNGGGVPSSAREVEFAHEMAQAAGVKPPYLMIEFAISPLAFNHTNLDLVYQLRNRPCFEALMLNPGPIPTLGGTAPIQMPLILAQSVAETLGGSILIDALTGGRRTPMCAAITAIAVDMRFGMVNFSSPEAILLLELGYEVGSYLTGRVTRGGAVRTIAKQPDPQAAAEKMMCVLVGALHGGRSFADVGQLSVDEIFSFEQVVIDREIIKSVERFVNGFDFPGELDPVQVIGEGLADRNFLTHPSTLEKFREVYWTPEIFDRRALHPWQKAGAPEVVARARETACRLIATQEMRLEEPARRELEKIYRQAAREIT